MNKIGILGYGNIGKVVAKCIKKYDPSIKIVASDLQPITDSSIEQVKARQLLECKQVFLCIKPSDIHNFAFTNFVKEYKKRSHSTIFVSSLAAIQIDTLASMFDSPNFLRIMPTVTADVGGPVTIYDPFNICMREEVLLPFIGRQPINNEDMFDLTTATSGCMPGFLGFVFEQFLEAMIQQGLERKVAEDLLYKNLTGMVWSMKNHHSLADYCYLQKNVSSKGGATEKGILSMRRSEIEFDLWQAIETANDHVKTMITKLNKRD